MITSLKGNKLFTRIPLQLRNRAIRQSVAIIINISIFVPSYLFNMTRAVHCRGEPSQVFELCYKCQVSSPPVLTDKNVKTGLDPDHDSQGFLDYYLYRDNHSSNGKVLKLLPIPISTLIHATYFHNNLPGGKGGGGGVQSSLPQKSTL